VAHDPSRTTVSIALAVFGLGFGVVGQVLTVAVQNGVERRRLGVAMAATSFFRGLGGAAGAAALGAVFAARVGAHPASTLGRVARPEVIDGVATVFTVAAPLAALALVLSLALPEAELARMTPASASK
jgi:MFS family permease